MQVMHMHLFFHCEIAVFIRSAILHSPFDATAREPNGEPFRIMVAAVLTLGNRRASKLATPHDQGIVQ
jgi:hypothetical protein